MSPISIYIHYPFCKSKCPYCDFNSHIRANIDYEAFLAAYFQELEYFAQFTNQRPVKSIFFGGGTPSLMPVPFVAKLLEKIDKLWNLDEKIEISLEANPTSSEAENFRLLRKAGINRLSLGIQSLREKDLKFLGRNHSAIEAKGAIKDAARYFDNFSFDLIYARQNQTVAEWKDELREALSVGSTHLSLYQLTIEKGTEFFKSYRDKKFELPNIDIQDALYDVTGQICADYGLELYEISNYAKQGFECLHNLNYWQYGDYIGIGAGAHGRISVGSTQQKTSFINHHVPEKWLEKVLADGHAIQKKTVLSQQEILEEILIMGLRTKFGINGAVFQQYLGKNHIELFGDDKLSKLSAEGLINYDQIALTPTLKGLKLANSVYQFLL